MWEYGGSARLINVSIKSIVWSQQGMAQPVDVRPPTAEEVAVKE
ncbi:unnamed protein product, partial [Allacma fusca]